MNTPDPSESFSVEILLSQWSDAECRAVLEGMLDEVPEAVEWVWERS